jgi:hypothetical protein
MPTKTPKGAPSSGRQYGAVGINEESTSLLTMKPSPSSTGASTKASSSYQANESRKLLEVSDSKDSFADNHVGKIVVFYRNNRNMLLGVAAVAVFAIAAFAVPWHPGASSQVHPDGFPTKYHGSLSKLHPVDDLGLYSFARSKDSSPPSALTKGAEKNGGRASFPTNAWYQNILMMDDEPSNIHRVYTVPFVLDPAGPIPGLRVHPNHIKASTAVVQLNTVEAYALTVGATADATEKHNTTETHGYIIENMTPLGVTLGYVSYEQHTWNNKRPVILSVAIAIPHAFLCLLLLFINLHYRTHTQCLPRS